MKRFIYILLLLNGFNAFAPGDPAEAAEVEAAREAQERAVEEQQAEQKAQAQIEAQEAATSSRLSSEAGLPKEPTTEDIISSILNTNDINRIRGMLIANPDDIAVILNTMTADQWSVIANLNNKGINTSIVQSLTQALQKVSTSENADMIVSGLLKTLGNIDTVWGKISGPTEKNFGSLRDSIAKINLTSDFFNSDAVTTTAVNSILDFQATALLNANNPDVGTNFKLLLGQIARIPDKKLTSDEVARIEEHLLQFSDYKTMKAALDAALAAKKPGTVAVVTVPNINNITSNDITSLVVKAAAGDQASIATINNLITQANTSTATANIGKTVINIFNTVDKTYQNAANTGNRVIINMIEPLRKQIVSSDIYKAADMYNTLSASIGLLDNKKTTAMVTLFDLPTVLSKAIDIIKTTSPSDLTFVINRSSELATLAGDKPGVQQFVAELLKSQAVNAVNLNPKNIDLVTSMTANLFNKDDFKTSADVVMSVVTSKGASAALSDSLINQATKSLDTRLEQNLGNTVDDLISFYKATESVDNLNADILRSSLFGTLSDRAGTWSSDDALLVKNKLTATIGSISKPAINLSAKLVKAAMQTVIDVAKQRITPQTITNTQAALTFIFDFIAQVFEKYNKTVPKFINDVRFKLLRDDYANAIKGLDLTNIDPTIKQIYQTRIDQLKNEYGTMGLTV